MAKRYVLVEIPESPEQNQTLIYAPGTLSLYAGDTFDLILQRAEPPLAQISYQVSNISWVSRTWEGDESPFVDDYPTRGLTGEPLTLGMIRPFTSQQEGVYTISFQLTMNRGSGITETITVIIDPQIKINPTP